MTRLQITSEVSWWTIILDAHYDLQIKTYWLYQGLLCAQWAIGPFPYMHHGCGTHFPVISEILDYQQFQNKTQNLPVHVFIIMINCVQLKRIWTLQQWKLRYGRNNFIIVSPVRSTYGGYYGLVVVTPRPPPPRPPPPRPPPRPRPQTLHRSHDNLKKMGPVGLFMGHPGPPE